ncbi:MAG: endonuclease MutS2 [Oscillospiraceae bacterium]|nr:endonuclease MutS2 [Oscillospiraceae bacterium]
MDKNLKILEYDKVLEKLSLEAATAVIKEMCLNLRPESSSFKAERLMRETETAYIFCEKFGAPSFGDVLDINEHLEKASVGAVLTLRELLEVAAVLRNIRTVSDFKRNIDMSAGPLSDYFNALFPLVSLENSIYTSIENEDTVSDKASLELYRIRRQIISSGDAVRAKLEGFIRSASTQKYLQENIITSRDGRFVLPVKSEHRGDISGLVHDTSASGQTLFIEPQAVVELNNEIKILRAKEREEIEKIIRALSASVNEYSETIRRSYESLKILGLIFTKALYGIRLKGIIPKFQEEYGFQFKKARHPLIEKERVVPIDIRLGEDFDTLIITGPNTGGKTVSIKTAGLLSLMAASGLMLPCEEGSSVSVFSAVLPDIGDEQSIEQSLSTFSGHMKRISEIMDRATVGSLVLIDELGAGTDPTEGAALAEAIIEAFREKGALVIVTTHYAELKVYALETKGVSAASSEFDIKTLKPTYKLSIGSLGKSNAFLISSSLGISDDIIKKASALIKGESRRFEDILSELENKRQELNHREEEIAKLEEEIKHSELKLRKKTEEFEKNIEREQKRITENAKMRAERITAEAEALLDEIREIKKNKNKENINDLAIKAKGAFKAHIGEIDKLTEDTEKKKAQPFIGKIAIGDRVLITNIGKEAKVTALPDKNGRVAVEFGAIKTKVELSDLAPVKAAAKSSHQVVKAKDKRLNPDLRLDIRGQTAEEARMELDIFIDNAVMARASVLTIVHGKGTGVLRKMVSSYLKGHKSVASYRLGVFGEGEDGVTIVTLK